MIKLIASRAYLFVRSTLNKMLIPKGFVAVKVNDNQLFFFDPSNSSQGFLLYTTGKYGSGTELLAQLFFSHIIKNGYVVVDVGAHFGFYTLIAAAKVGKSGLVMAFEPSKTNFRVLRVNILANRLTNVKLYKVALADENGRAVLGVPRGRLSGENTLAVNPSQAEQLEVVEVRRFDEIAEEEGISKVDVVKIDVEGAEYKVLKGFGNYLDTCKYIILEVHPSQMVKLGTSPKELYALLNRHGYNLYWLDKKAGIIPVSHNRLMSKILTRHHLICAKQDLELDKIRLRLMKYDLIVKSSFTRRQRLAMLFNNPKYIFRRQNI
ncbi:methyltransferase FkbM family [Pyrolobus fumarii 1A]|uniref:Methyltransferase FkbM family n=1 Tax=Pyrolobus fumarii (strain DSM 11204 / 1A) TaxID=694429 RepID=G0EHG9_PYRF1|nr:FkbM family methyltransferase [Pyrolobus fumarii]AEM38544.1 methyltransferase FkbM family [Pyrolobus fumarii 1A]